MSECVCCVCERERGGGLTEPIKTRFQWEGRTKMFYLN